MKRIIAVSDSHGLIVNLQDAARLALGIDKVDVFIHLGDGAADFEAIRPLLLGYQPDMQLISVRGNCDFSSNAPYLEEVMINGRKIIATHGHLYHVKQGLSRLSYAARERNASVVFFGHTHESLMEEAYGIWMINPGAVSRGTRNGPAFAEILFDEDGGIQTNLVGWSGKAL